MPSSDLTTQYQHLPFLQYCYRYHAHLLSFPTRRSSDLGTTSRISGSFPDSRRPSISVWVSLFAKRRRAIASHSMTPTLKTSARWSTTRSEEHTSELQSLRHIVCRLLT